jgi:flagellar hook protein FlgE
MISGIYPYILAGSAGGLKKFENSFQSAANATINSFRSGTSGEKESLSDPLGTKDGMSLSASGSITPGSSGLFAHVSDVSFGQEIPQMIEAQRGYEAYLKVIRTEDETAEYTLDTFA